MPTTLRVRRGTIMPKNPDPYGFLPGTAQRAPATGPARGTPARPAARSGVAPPYTDQVMPHPGYGYGYPAGLPLAPPAIGGSYGDVDLDAIQRAISLAPTLSTAGGFGDFVRKLQAASRRPTGPRDYTEQVQPRTATAPRDYTEQVQPRT